MPANSLFHAALDGGDYLREIAQLAKAVVAVLAKAGAPEDKLVFGGAGPKVTARLPTDARSEFLANRAMGDWAEGLLADGLAAAFRQAAVCHYGNSDRIAAGDPGFKEFYTGRLEDVRVHGKRPDLLMLAKADGLATDLSDQDTLSLMPLAKGAAVSIEVRSSKYEALHYIAYKAAQRRDGVAKEGEVPNFTVKIEDLCVVYRWIETHLVQQMYAQVFFDSVYAINFLEIFGVIASGKGFTLEKPNKSQGKFTIYVPITKGHRIDRETTMPQFLAQDRRTKAGRHDAYVVPVGGRTVIDPAAFQKAVV